MKLYLDTAGKELVIIAGIEKIPAIITSLKTMKRQSYWLSQTCTEKIFFLKDPNVLPVYFLNARRKLEMFSYPHCVAIEDASNLSSKINFFIFSLI